MLLLDGTADTTVAALIGLFGGVLLGLAARLGRFCTLGAIEDLLYQDSSIRMRMWCSAIGIAILGTFSLIGTGFLDAASTTYLSSNWNPAGTVIGGLMFGYGMAMAGNCGFGALARLGGGDLRSFVIVVVMGLTGFMALSGPLATFRIYLFPQNPSSDALPGIAQLLNSVTGISPVTAGLIIGIAVLAAAVASREFLRDPSALFWSGVVGVAIISGWAGTQWVAASGFDFVPVVSHTFTAPVGRTILYMMTSSGNTLSFGIGSVAGVLLGAFAGSVYKGHFRWEACEDPRELKRQMAGAAMMGVGAVLATGCTIGQGISAFSVLAYSAPVTFLAIIGGAALGLKHLIFGYTAVG